MAPPMAWRSLAAVHADVLGPDTAHAISRVGQWLRLGTLLPLALVVTWAVLRALPSRMNDATWAYRVGAAVTLAAAGVAHLVLVAEHLREAVVVGVFFVLSGLAELAIAALILRAGPTQRLAAVTIIVVSGVVVLYVASRTASLPLGIDREAVDALGLTTKALEVLGGVLTVIALSGSAPRISRSVEPWLVAGVAAMAAVIARPLFGLGPHLAQLAVTVLVALLTRAVVVKFETGAIPSTITDAAIVALLVRAPGVVAFVALGSTVALLRALLHAAEGRSLAPIALSALGVLWVPAFGARLEILHVSHRAEPFPFVVGFLLAGGTAFALARRGRLHAVVGFYVMHLAAQAMRLASGATSLETIEVPATSLGLLVLTAAVLGDTDLDSDRRFAVGAGGVLAGGLDVALRAAGIAYAPLIALAVAIATISLAPGRGLPGEHPAPKKSVRQRRADQKA